MPLSGTVSERISELVKEGYPQKQAVAIAYDSMNTESLGSSAQEPTILDAYSEPEPLLCQILPKRDVNDGNVLIPLSNPNFYNRTYLSLKRWVKEAKPSLLKEHNREGDSYGKVTDIVSMEDGLHAVIVMDPSTYREYKDGRYRYVSPYIAWNFKADDYDPSKDNLWDAALLETSLVSVPRFLLGQKPIGSVSLDSVSRLENVSVMNSRLDNENIGSFYLEEVDMEELMKMIKGMLDEHTKTLREEFLAKAKEEKGSDMETVEVKEEVSEKVSEEDSEMAAKNSCMEEDLMDAEEDLESSDSVEKETSIELRVEEEVPADKSEEEASEEEDSEMAEDPRDARIVELESRIAELEALVADYEAETAVVSDLADKPHLSSMRQSLKSAYMKDRNLYADILKMPAPASTVSAFSERMTIGYTPSKNTLPADPFAAARVLSERENIGYTEAFRRVTEGK